MAIETRIIQVRRGKEAELDKSKFLPGEFGSATDTQKIFHAFAPNKVKELASKEDVQRLIDGFTSVVDREIAEAEQRIESKAETVLGTIPDDYETVSQKADEAVRTKADAIVCTVSGVNPIAKDSSNDYLRNLKLYGKTTQPTTSGKNHLNNQQVTTLTGGVTFTVNEDKSVTLSGTATVDATFAIDSNIPKGNYIVNGCPKGGSYTTYDVYVYSKTQGTTIARDFGDGGTFEITEENSISYIIRTRTGQTYNNLVFYPMIRLASITDPTYEMYTYAQPLESVGKWGNLYTVTNTHNESWKIQDDGSLILTTDGGISELNYITLQKGTYTMAVHYENSSVIPCIIFRNRNSETNYNSNYGSGKNYFTYTFTEETEVRVLLQATQNTGKVSVGCKAWLTITKGDKPLDSYRPYSGQREIASGVYGKNLYTQDLFKDDDYVLNNGYYRSKNPILKAGNYIWSGKYFQSSVEGITVRLANSDRTKTYPMVGASALVQQTIIQTTEDLYMEVNYAIYGFNSACVLDGQIELGTVATEYEPYTKQSHISLVGDGLKGIPVTDASLATYTDENGQMWCSDYVDCERGVLVQRIGSIVLDGSLEYTKNDATENNDNYLYYYWCPSLLKGHDDTDKILCDKFITKIGAYQINNTNSIEYAGIATSGIKAIYINLGYLMEENTTEEFKRVISENPLTVQYILEEPIETPLTASEIESYKALRSNYKVTSVMNDCECYESITYNADTETWINNKIEARVASVLASLAL